MGARFAIAGLLFGLIVVTPAMAAPPGGQPGNSGQAGNSGAFPGGGATGGTFPGGGATGGVFPGGGNGGTVSAVEPSSILLTGAALLGAALLRRRR